MLDADIEKALNNQINAELYSSYLYLSMAAGLSSINLEGFAQWMTAQSQEEYMHAMKFYNYVNDRGGRVTLQAIEAPPTEWNCPLGVFEATYEHETKVTGLINDLAGLAASKNDNATLACLQWFITEQVEEEATADGIVQKLKMVKDAPYAIFMIDQELGQRPAPAGPVADAAAPE